MPYVLCAVSVKCRGPMSPQGAAGLSWLAQALPLPLAGSGTQWLHHRWVRVSFWVAGVSAFSLLNACLR
jgi:hypothetical protein